MFTGTHCFTPSLGCCRLCVVHTTTGQRDPTSTLYVPCVSCLQLIAVLDVDSEVLAAFDHIDKEELEALLAKWFE